jgi:PAS domain S-box-containing protein
MTPRNKSGQPAPRRKPVPKRALDSLGAPEALQAVFEKSPDVVMIVDREGRISYINRHFPQFPPSQVYGADLCTFVPLEYRAAMAACYARVFRDGVSERYEVTGPGPDGSMVTYDSRVVPIVHDGRVTEALVTAADVTERRRAEQTHLATYRNSASAPTATSLQTLFAAIHGIVGGLMPARNFYIALHDPATDTISFPYFVDQYDAAPEPKTPGKEDTVITAEGISIFDDEDLEIEAADPMAKTQIAPSLDDQVAIEGVGSGSGLLDLTRESDEIGRAHV